MPKLQKKRQEDIRAVIVLEMIGFFTQEPNSQSYPPFLGPFYPNTGNYIAVVGDFASKRLANDVLNSFKKASDFPIESLISFSFVPGVDFSDHWSFWKEGYPAVMITDTSFYRNPNYHKQSDKYQTLDYERMREVILGLESVLSGLSN